MTVTAAERYGRPFVRALLREEGVPANGLFAVQHALTELGAPFGIYDVANELGVRIPTMPIYASPRAPRVAPPRKSRTR